MITQEEICDSYPTEVHDALDAIDRNRVARALWRDTPPRPSNLPSEARLFAWRVVGCLLALVTVCGAVALADALIQMVAQ